MKKYFVCLGAALTSMLTLTNCNREEIPSPNGYEGTIPFSITAGTPEVKTVNDGAFGTDWAAGDGVNLFYSETGKTSYLTAGKFSIAEADLETRTFRGLLASELAEDASYDWYVVYPYNVANATPTKTTVTVGSAADAVQTQTGDGSLAHIAGECYPVCGSAKGVASAASPSIFMKHLTSLVEVEVTNAAAAPLTVSEIELVAEEAIVGEFYADITKDVPTYSAVSAAKVSSSAKLNVAGASALAQGASAKYYLAVKPFTAPAGSVIKVLVNGTERFIEMPKDVVFSPGLKKTIKFEYDLVLAPDVTASKVAFSGCDIEWTSDGLAQSFNIYVNGQLFKEGLSAETLSYHVTGLRTGVENTIEVEAVADEKARGEVKVTTKGVYEYEKSTGTSFLCIGWDAPSRTELHGKTQIYQIQVFADENMSKKVYDFVPMPGGNNTNDYLFGNGSYYGYTQQHQGPDGITSANYLTPTRVSVGGFYPNTTYYVRVKMLASYKQSVTNSNGTKEISMTNPFGETEWSELVPMSTDAVHVPAANEIIYGGFNDMCVQTDFLNNCLGAKNATSGSAIAWDKRPEQFFQFYVNNHNWHQASTFGLASGGKRIDGSTTLVGYSNCAIHTGNAVGKGNTYIGDMAGWIWTAWSRPLMGAYALDGTSTFVATPALTSDKLSAEGTDCVLTFKASYKTRITDSYGADTDVLSVQVWRASSSSYDVITTYKTAALVPFDVEKDTAKEVLNDYGRNTFKLDITLHPGDNVEFVAKRSGSIILDDILVVTK